MPAQRSLHHRSAAVGHLNTKTLAHHTWNVNTKGTKEI